MKKLLIPLLIFVLMIQIFIPQSVLACQPKISVDPITVNFGGVLIGSTSSTHTLTIYNQGDNELIISALVINDTQFHITDENVVGNALVSDASGYISLVFSPNNVSSQSGTLRIFSNATNQNPVTVNMVGTGILPPSPEIDISPLDIDFGDVLVGSSSSPETVTIRNIGTAGLEIGDITFDNNLFTIIANNASGQALSPGTSINMSLVFSPTNTGPQTATMSIFSNDPDENPVTVCLTGTGSSGGSSAGVMAVEPMYFIVDFLGKITQELADEDGRPVENITANSPDGLHVLEILQGTAATDVDGNPVMLVEIRYVTAPQLPENTELIGRVFEFDPLETTFDQIIKLTLAYDINGLPDNMTSLGMAYYNAGQGWTYLATTDSIEGEIGKLTASVNHLGIYAILAQVAPLTETVLESLELKRPPAPEPPTPEPTSFLLSNLSIITSSESTKIGFTAITRTGEEATISVDVTNIGGELGNYLAVLMVNGSKQGSQEVTLEPGQTKTVTFTLESNEPGTYLVEIDDLSGTFMSELLINFWLFCGLIAVIVIIGVGIWFFLLRRNRRVPQET